jgi:glycosyltransferase involved in cell wall biosynthesis
MPFAGDADAARGALAALRSLDTRSGDQLILADNSGVAVELSGVEVVAASGESSPAHARNVGAAHAARDWILFLDADCEPAPDLLDEYFSTPVDARVGALAGVVVPAADPHSVAERYATARNFLGQDAHLAHPYLPRAVAANLMVRRATFEALGGFAEGVRAGEDTDFSWRLQQAGWLLEPRPARVAHRYRATVRELRRQWRGYAAGRAWLARRYEGFAPEPALARALRRRPRRGTHISRAATMPPPSWRDRFVFLGLDVVLGFEELVGLRMSNRAGER